MSCHQLIAAALASFQSLTNNWQHRREVSYPGEMGKSPGVSYWESLHPAGKKIATSLGGGQQYTKCVYSTYGKRSINERDNKMTHPLLSWKTRPLRKHLAM